MSDIDKAYEKAKRQLVSAVLSDGSTREATMEHAAAVQALALVKLQESFDGIQVGDGDGWAINVRRESGLC